MIVNDSGIINDRGCEIVANTKVWQYPRVESAPGVCYGIQSHYPQ